MPVTPPSPRSVSPSGSGAPQNLPTDPSTEAGQQSPLQQGMGTTPATTDLFQAPPVAAARSAASAQPAALSPFPSPPPDLDPSSSTRLPHQGPPALGERSHHIALPEVLRRFTGLGKNLTPGEKADAVTEWLEHNSFTVESSHNGDSDRRSRLFHRKMDKRKLLDDEHVSMNPPLPWLKKEQIGAVYTLLLDRLNAVKADPEAVSDDVRGCLVRYFEAASQGKAQDLIHSVHIRGTRRTLTRLSAFHMDDVYFNPNYPLDRGQQRAFFAGVTREGYPVRIKRIDVGGQAVARARRKLQIGGYLQAHLGIPPQPTWLVTPCYSGSLQQLASLFLRIPYRPRVNHSGGLVGARYIFHKTLGELAFFHDERHVLHEDIRPRNIYISQKQRRFILGNLGSLGELSAQQDAPFAGLTYGFASPEQVAELKRITTASDIFNLGATLAYCLLRDDPAVEYTWEKLYGGSTPPKSLFPHDPGEADAAFAAWDQFLDDDDTLHSITQGLVLTGLSDRRASLVQQNLSDYHRFAAVMMELDAELWQALCLGLKINPEARPAAKVLQQTLALSEEDERACDAAWEAIAPYDPAFLKEAEALKPLLDQLT